MIGYKIRLNESRYITNEYIGRLNDETMNKHAVCMKVIYQIERGFFLHIYRILRSPGVLK